jgi:hypothetical protein
MKGTEAVEAQVNTAPPPPPLHEGSPVSCCKQIQVLSRETGYFVPFDAVGPSCSNSYC